MTDLETVRVETPSEGVRRIVLSREPQRNAQNKQMTYDLNTAFDDAAKDDTVWTRTKTTIAQPGPGVIFELLEQGKVRAFLANIIFC